MRVLTYQPGYVTLAYVRFDGDRLRALRLAKRWDQHRLAEETRHYGTGITQAAVSRHERNLGEPSGRNALAYALALGVSCEYLYNEDEQEVEEDPLDRLLENVSIDDLLTKKLLQIAVKESREAARAGGES